MKRELEIQYEQYELYFDVISKDCLRLTISERCTGCAKFHKIEEFSLSRTIALQLAEMINDNIIEKPPEKELNNAKNNKRTTDN